MKPLDGIRIVDFSAQLPGPLASLILAEAGAEVIRIEPPGAGDMLRSYPPLVGEESVNFAMLNGGKRSIAIDLKAPGAAERLYPLIATADIVLEQFRPGVMERLGMGYETLRALKSDLIFCSITGYGQQGDKTAEPGHDLNYCAESGLLNMACGADGAPVVPAALVADIAGGSYPAVMNILLALRQRDRTGQGAQIDIAMTDNLFVFMYWAMARGFATGEWPRPGADILTGGSPRYSVYCTADGRYLAVAALEEKFWQNLADVIGLSAAERRDQGQEARTRAAVAALIAARPAAHWQQALAGKDTCTTLVATLEEAVQNPHFTRRGLFDGQLQLRDRQVPNTPVPLAPGQRDAASVRRYPELGEANAQLLADRRD